MNRNFSVMIKPASSLCNMRCRYCFYANIADLREVKSYGVMSAEIRNQMLARFEEQLNDGDHFVLAFQGGEPTMAGLAWFKEFVNEVKKWKKKIQIEFALQTNGINLNKDWCQFLHDNHFLVGISLDLLKEYHDATRVDAKGDGTYNRVVNAMHLMDKYHVEYNVLCTLTNSIARSPLKVWNELVKLDVRYVQFTPCLNDLNDDQGVYGITPQRFASFYKTIFDKWYADFIQGKYRSVKLIDDIANLLAYGMPTACGMNGKCQPQLVVEANGNVYPCDFYCLDENCIGNVLELTLEELYDLSKNHITKKETTLPQHCDSCPFLKMCYGNCKRMRPQICLKEGEQYCGYQDFLNYSFERFVQIAKAQRRI